MSEVSKETAIDYTKAPFSWVFNSSVHCIICGWEFVYLSVSHLITGHEKVKDFVGFAP